MAPGGYAWWYLDALSDDGCHGLTLIAFIGSVFSPYYAWARRRGDGLADAQQHCAVNVALYKLGPGGRRLWAMTERGRHALDRDARHLCIGPSELAWEGDALQVQLDEIGAPWPARCRGTLRLQPQALAGTSYALDAAGHHRWGPIAPRARIDVDLGQPGLHWQGQAYLDHNAGDRPLERDFVRWDWSRAARADGSSVLLYDVTPRQGEPIALALDVDAQGQARPLDLPPPLALPRSGWGVARGTRADGAQARVLRTLEDTPFYARSLLETTLRGERLVAMHESLSLTRFASPWVQAMLPFKMPRRGRWAG